MLQALGIGGTVLGALALGAAAVSFVALGRAGRLTKDYLHQRGVLDGWLFGTWGVLLAGSVGLLAGAPWAATMLRVWVGMLVVWTLWYTGANLYVLRSLEPEVPVQWRSVLTGLGVAWLLVGVVAAGVLVVLSRAGL